jgi:hypothetical protein
MMEKIPADKRFGTKPIIDKLFVDGEKRKNFASMRQGLSIFCELFEKHKDSPSKVAGIKVVERVFSEFRVKHEKKERENKRSRSRSLSSGSSDEYGEEDGEGEDEDEEDEEYADEDEEEDDEEEEDSDENASMDASEGSIERENIQAELDILEEVEKDNGVSGKDFIDLEADASDADDDEEMFDEEEEKKLQSEFIDENDEEDDDDGTMHQRIFNKLEKKKFKSMLGSKVTAIGKLDIKNRNKRSKKDDSEKGASKAKKEEEERIKNRIEELKEIEKSVRPGNTKADKAENNAEVFRGYAKYVLLSVCFANSKPELIPCMRLDIDHFSFIAPDNHLVKTGGNTSFYTLIFLNKCAHNVHRLCLSALKTFRTAVSATAQHEALSGRIIKMLHAIVNPLTFSVSVNCSSVFTSEAPITAVPNLRCEMSGYESTDASEFSAVRFDVDRKLLAEIEKEPHFYSSFDITKYIPIIASSVTIGKSLKKVVIVRTRLVPVITAYFMLLHFEFVADRIIYEHVPDIATLNPSYSMVEKIVDETPKIAEGISNQLQWATTIVSKTKFTYKQ